MTEKQQIWVIKVGSALLIDDDGRLRLAWLHALVEDVVALLDEGKQVVIVSSGSVALGREKLGLKGRDLRVSEKQAAAACGQLELIKAYEDALQHYDRHAAQVLLTVDDSDDRRRYLNAKHTLENLLEAGVVPIVNENDTIATSEMRFGDNDRLAARVAQMIAADTLVLLSDIDGLYTANPRKEKDAKHIPEVSEITDDILAMADREGSLAGTGGMVTKLAAAEIAAASRCNTLNALGEPMHPIQALKDGARHTIFIAEDTPDSAWRNWIAHSLNITGELVVDDGAIRALQKGNSLLPVGLTAVEGEFRRGDAVSIMDADGNEIGRGLVNYHSEDAQRIIGKHSEEIADILGYVGRETLVHRNDMVVF